MRSRVIERLQRSVQPPVRPICDCLEGSTFWIVTQRGDADYVKNMAADLRVRVKGSLSSSAWRAGTAEMLDDDEPKERARILGRGNRWRRLCLQASAAVATSPLTIHIDLDPEWPTSHPPRPRPWTTSLSSGGARRKARAHASLAL